MCAPASSSQPSCATGCEKSGSKRLLNAVEDLLDEINVPPFDVPADGEYGEICSHLEATEKQIGGNDTLITAHPLALGATIVIANVRRGGGGQAPGATSPSGSF